VDNLKQIFKNPLGITQGIFYLRKLAFLSFFLYFGQVFSQAKLEVVESKKNFGFVKRGELVKNNYEISNIGNEPLLITDAEVSCSCTTVDFPKQPLLPGQKAIITVNFNTATVYGRQDRVVYLHSNDPKGETKLRYKGTVSAK
jgi:hypothetical protein